MNRSDSIDLITDALSKAQASFLPVKRTERVDYATTSGRKKYSYAPLSEVLEACRKALSDNGLAIVQMPGNDNGNITVDTYLLHKSGQWVSCVLGLKAVSSDPQTVGSLITYLRRYSLSSLLGIAADEDDDAIIASSAEATTDHKDTQQKDKIPSTKEHWCEKHGVNFFMRGNMKSYAHPVKDAQGKDVLDDRKKAIWCYEPKKEEEILLAPPETAATISPGLASDKVKAETSPEIPAPQQNPPITDFGVDVELLKKHATRCRMTLTDMLRYCATTFKKQMTSTKNLEGLLTQLTLDQRLALFDYVESRAEVS